MGKDPAVLFYTSDFLSGTILLSYEEKGQYISLLCIQHQIYPDHIPLNHMISVCLSNDSPVIKKFSIDCDGKYYNKRMEEEIEKRVNYCNSRSNNKSGRKKNKSYDKSYDNHMLLHMENENENINKNINEDIPNLGLKNKSKKRNFIKPTIEDVKTYFKEKGYSENIAIKFFESYDVANWHDSNGKKVINWKQKAIQVWFKDDNINSGKKTNKIQADFLNILKEGDHE